MGILNHLGLFSSKVPDKTPSQDLDPKLLSRPPIMDNPKVKEIINTTLCFESLQKSLSRKGRRWMLWSLSGMHRFKSPPRESRVG